jgi:predicted nuclease of predicted toxin-antitoxin system
MEYCFLIDVNLPKFFGFFNKPEFQFVVDIRQEMTDTEIWDYTSQNDLVIVTKDRDFYNRFILADTHPKIIYLKIGNSTLKELHQFFTLHWQTITAHLAEADMIMVEENNITLF